MSIESDLLQQIKDILVAYNGLSFVPQNGNTTINGIKTFTSQPIVPTPTLDTSPTTKAYVDNPTIYSSLITVTDGGDLDFSTVTNASNYNWFTITCSGATASIRHILNLPHGSWIWINTGKTITFLNKYDSATGFIQNFGGSNFVAVGTNGDGGYFINQTGYIQRTGGGNN